MIIETLKKLYKRDLNKLKIELEAYKSEGAIWKVEKEVPNSAGNLCLHLLGNLNTYIGAEIGKTGYVRQRELEFATEYVPRDELIIQIQELDKTVEIALESLSEKELEKDYPQIVFDDKMTTGYFLLHLLTHLTYHLGQINYHRRFCDNEN